MIKHLDYTLNIGNKPTKYTMNAIKEIAIQVFLKRPLAMLSALHGNVMSM